MKIRPHHRRLRLTLCVVACLGFLIPTGMARTIIMPDDVPTGPETWILTVVHSGKAGAPTVIRPAGETTGKYSGGKLLTGWRPLAPGEEPGLPAMARAHIWSVGAPPGVMTRPVRQLWVNHRKAIRARWPTGDRLMPLAGWDRQHQLAIIPLDPVSARALPTGVEMMIDQVWEMADLRVSAFEVSAGKVAARFAEPERTLEFEHPWPPVQVNQHYAAPFYLTGAPPWLDQPGEWYADAANQRIYYWPRPGEAMPTVTAVIPVTETLVRVQGTRDQPVRHLRFENLTFADTGWWRPAQTGHVPLQAGMRMTKALKLKPRGKPYHPGLDNVAWIERPSAAVRVEYAEDVTFVHCRFVHLGGSGLDLGPGTKHIRVEGCVFEDIGINGLQMGEFSEPNEETHAPYQPADAREVCEDVVIANNVVRDCGTEDWGGVGICAGYVRRTAIEHNLVCDLPYTGISLGWGWTATNNVMRENRVVANEVTRVGRVLGDFGGIYTLSAQPGTLIASNVVTDLRAGPYVPDPDHWYYLYLDEGSAGITVRDNWCPTEKFLCNANGPGNLWTNNGPQVTPEIRQTAGLERRWRELLP